LREPFRKHLPRDVDVRAFLENRRDDGQTLNGFRADGIQIARAVQCVFDRARDKRLDLLRREARRFGLHRRLRLDEFGKHIELRVRRDEQPVANETERQRDDHAARA
jgi:hypothetical protein